MAKKLKKYHFKKLKKYHFNCGNSNTGTVGFCGVLEAFSKKEALQKLKELMPWEHEIKGFNDFEYLTAYFNSEAIKLTELSRWED